MAALIVHSKNRKQIIPGEGQEAYEYDTGIYFIYSRKQWRLLYAPSVVGIIVRTMLTADATPKQIYFPQPTATNDPAVSATGWTLDGAGKKKDTIQIYITDIDRYGFKAAVLDEDCMLEFTYGDPVIIA